MHKHFAPRCRADPGGALAADERPALESCDNARAASQRPSVPNPPSARLVTVTVPPITMSQTMEHTDSSSFRENEEPDKKQKSRRPPSTSANRDPAQCA
jgi:hypothetical protein